MFNKRKITTFVSFVPAGMLFVVSIFIAGCSKSPEELKVIQDQMNSPVITNIGTFENCEVLFVDRYYDKSSFYMAKCPSKSTTLTTNYKEQVGKVVVDKRKTVITQEIEKLNNELVELNAKEKALSKLSEEDRKALNIKE